MRKRDSGLSEEQATLVVCGACGSECDRHDAQVLQPQKPEKKDERLVICETCFEELPDELCDGEWEHLKPGKWSKLADWAKLHLILSFIPASGQINDVRDVEEFFDALTACVIWHPDTDFDDYIHLKTKKRLFGDAEAAELDKCMDRCREICDLQSSRVDPDIYALGMASLRRAGMAPKEMDETIHIPAGHVATAADRAKDSHLSADSIVYEQAESAKHTPLPWHIDADHFIASADELIADPRCEREKDPQEIDANAAFIVQACNSHDELLEACKAAEQWPAIVGSPTWVKIRAAIRKAERGAS